MTCSTDKVYQFDGLIFVESEKKLKRLNRIAKSYSRAFKKLKAEFEAFGLTAVKSVYLEEDEGQEDSEIKVFVSVQMTGTLGLDLDENEAPPQELAQLLSNLAEAVYGDIAAEDWELLSIEEHAE